MRLADVFSARDRLRLPGGRLRRASAARAAVDHRGGRILYFGSGNVETVSSGLDRVTRLHWREIAESGLDVHGFVVNPDAQGPSTIADGSGARLRVHPPVLKGKSRRRGLVAKLRSLIRPQALLQGLSLASPALADEARELVRTRPPDVVVIDHIYSVQNVPLRLLLPGRAKVVFVAHDHTPTLVRDLYTGARHLKGRIAFISDYVKAVVLERLVLARADRIVYLSDHDRDRYPGHRAKSVALLPFEPVPEAETAGPGEPRFPAPERYVVFLGSPGFLPNRYAIDWIRRALSPHLHAVDPGCRILLIGKGTADLAGAAPNVVGTGFVSDAELQRLLEGGVALLSPIRHGSGLKIKILDALSLGVPVIATEYALRGFGAFGITDVIDTADPAACAALIAAKAKDIGGREAERQVLADKVELYRRERAGRVAALLRELGAGP